MRLNRSEAFIATTLALLVAAGLAGMSLAISSAAQAVARCSPLGACNSQAAALGQLLTLVPGAQLASIGLATLIGASLGGLTVAAELEAGTAVLAWSIAPSRRRWLLDRAGGLAGLLVIMLLPWMFATWLLASSIPAGDGQMALDLYAGAGHVLGVGLVAFATATLLGVRTGRLIPTVVGASIATFLIAGALAWAFAIWHMAAAVDLGASDGLTLAVQAIDTQGVIHTLADAAADAQRRGRNLNDLYRIVELGIPSSGLGKVVVQEALCYTALAMAVMGGAFYRVTSRRPLS